MKDAKEAAALGNMACPELNSTVSNFLLKRHVASIAIQHGEGTWSANCFYAFDLKTVRMVFLSSMDTLHGRLMQQKPLVSGTVTGNTRTVSKIEGVQFRGLAESLTDKASRQIYNERFPFARFAESTLWAIHVDEIKYTSNLIAFAKKIIWTRY